jgi:aerobic-type carbon monoxide dehydrogenase small subunit (CoxS/CutS family)
VAGATSFTCNGRPVTVAAGPGTSLLVALREHLGLLAAKDGCAPQGQCGCCTVLVDGSPRVACVTPLERVAGRAVTTLEGLDGAADLAADLLATGGSQCGFCTPGIIVRAAALRRRGRDDLDRALAAHLCRCTGWLSIHEALVEPGVAVGPGPTAVAAPRAAAPASERARLEGGVPQRVDLAVPLGRAGFADDTAPRDALVAVPLPPGSAAPSVAAAGLEWVLGESLAAARERAGKVQGRRAPSRPAPPLAPPEVVPPAAALAAGRAVRLSTGWVEPAYVEPDASWCRPGGEPASPLANGGAFGGKASSAAPAAARELADRLGRTVRVVYSREDCVRLGPKRPPIGAAAWVEGDGEGGRVRVDVRTPVALPAAPWLGDLDVRQEVVRVPGPPVSLALRAAGWAELAVLAAGARGDAEPRVAGPSGAWARASVDLADAVPRAVRVHVAAGDPLDVVTLRSYVLGAVHQALGWMLSEGIAVDPVTGEVLEATIRSFGVLRARDMPPVEITVEDDPRPPLAGASDAVFAAVAAATWKALGCPETIPWR